MIALCSRPAFCLGVVLLTPLAKRRIIEHGFDPTLLINRHVHCDWSQISPDDQLLNQKAIKLGERILSAYKAKSETSTDCFYVITEADRSETRILHKEELGSFH